VCVSVTVVMIHDVLLLAGLVSTFAGSGISRYADGVGTLASFNGPSGSAVDKYDQSVLVVEQYNNRVRRISSAGRLLFD
jgi:hypothetical protein